MKKTPLLLLSISLLTGILSSSSLYGKFSLKRVYDFFRPTKHEAFVEKEYQLEKPGILSLSNIDGNITINTEWKRDTICLKATKRSSKEENLELLAIKTNRAEHITGNHLIITSAHENNATGSIDYQLIVPANIKLNLHTEHGTIKVNDVKGPVVAKTTTGDIDIRNVAHTVAAQTETKGSIVIEKVRDNIKAVTNNGNITITDATKSIIATTQKGNITTACSDVPKQSKIQLNSESSGAISLAMPASVNATLQGKTGRGRLTSEHLITINPFTTKLDRTAYREFTRQVSGILGTGDADIQLTSNSGNIRIIETQTT